MVNEADDAKAPASDAPEAPPAAANASEPAIASGKPPYHEHPAESAASTDRPKPRHTHDDASEWTASDSRGPLECADERERKVEDEEVAPTPVHAAIGALPAFAATERTSEAAKSADEAAAPPPAKRSAIAASLVLGALIGAGSAALVYKSYGAGGDATGGPQLASLQARVDALDKQGGGADVTGLKTTVADLDAKVAALTKGAGAPADVGPIEQKVAALQSAVDALKAQSGGGDVQAKVAALEADVASAKKESAAAQAGLAGVEGQQKLLVGKAMAPAVAVVADSLVQQIDHGLPYGAQVDALAALGVDPAKIALLRQNAETGVPSAKALAVKFEPLAEPIAATAHQPPANAGFVDKLKSGMYGLVSVRSVDDTSGTDLPSRVARIRADLAHDDVADALKTWDALPATAQAKGAAWAAAAKTQVEAMAAARGLQQDAIVALGAKKS